MELAGVARPNFRLGSFAAELLSFRVDLCPLLVQ